MKELLMSDPGVDEFLAFDIIGLDFCGLCKHIEKYENVIGICEKWLIVLQDLTDEPWGYGCDVDSCDKCSYFQKLEKPESKVWFCNKKGKSVDLEDRGGDDCFEDKEW